MRNLVIFESTSLEGWNVKNIASTSGSGTYYQFEYHTNYANYSAVEKVVLFKPKGSDMIKIIGHNISSDAFLK